MTIFWVAAALMTVSGLLILAPALLRPNKTEAEDLNARNVRIARERLAELESERESGVLSGAMFEQAKADLEGNLIDDLRDAKEAPLEAAPAKLALASVLVLVPLVALLLYLTLGAPGLLVVQGDHQSGQPGKPSMEEMLVKLEEKLKENPDNAEGWFILGRSYSSLGRYPEAVAALEKVHKLAGDNPSVLTALADVLALASGGKVSGRPEELLRKALEQAPDDPTALWMLGIAMQEQAKHKEAIAYWRRVLPQVQDDPKTSAQLGSLIERSMQEGGLSEADIPTVAPVPANPGIEIRVSVILDEKLKEKVAPGDSLFVMAKAIEGPPMPLAVVKLKAADLPAEVSLTDAMAMSPDLRLSKFPKVLVQARIVKGAGPMAQSGDLESDSLETATAGAEPLRLVIGRVLP
ncbi:MAG: c-type cytochrome biogenesis protein CcmI [Gammaproteobacteria bacterium RIFOXYA12_FULL_61_12]|nr:MAG: c-type cytochrome biogenesis protein CcmI [Gammaproteobacteria bacterium RIFOXYD12_FULL_61_37]OGT93622.1 MAG: c-type cytochrome biogenesis protein CcmI [Gammaproteobacteria bacterium RIFOXYA12_FULL_61_12]